MSAIDQDDTTSPCISVCTLNPQTQLCEGCLRNIDEITQWSSYSPMEKRRVLAKLAERCQRLTDGTFC